MEIKKYITENEPKMLEFVRTIRIAYIKGKPEHHHDEVLARAERWAQLLLLEAGAMKPRIPLKVN